MCVCVRSDVWFLSSVLSLMSCLCVLFTGQLLGELLLDRHNFTVMTRYISKPENLKLMMNLLRDKSPNIQFEAFHVFKVPIFLFPLFSALENTICKKQTKKPPCKISSSNCIQNQNWRVTNDSMLTGHFMQISWEYF